jgi:hypothetical protein
MKTIAPLLLLAVLAFAWVDLAREAMTFRGYDAYAVLADYDGNDAWGSTYLFGPDAAIPGCGRAGDSLAVVHETSPDPCHPRFAFGEIVLDNIPGCSLWAYYMHGNASFDRREIIDRSAPVPPIDYAWHPRYMFGAEIDAVFPRCGYEGGCHGDNLTVADEATIDSWAPRYVFGDEIGAINPKCEESRDSVISGDHNLQPRWLPPVWDVRFAFGEVVPEGMPPSLLAFYRNGNTTSMRLGDVDYDFSEFIPYIATRWRDTKAWIDIADPIPCCKTPQYPPAQEGTDGWVERYNFSFVYDYECCLKYTNPWNLNNLFFYDWGNETAEEESEESD